MKKISFNYGTLGFHQNRAYYELPRSHIYLDSENEIQRIQELKQIAFTCTVKVKEQHLQMDFTIDEGFIPFIQVKKGTIDFKLKTAEYLIKLGYFFANQQELVTIFDPLNFFVNEDGELKLLYRGIKGLMPAEGYESEPILDQVKRMLLLVFTGARWDELRINGLSFAKTKTKAGQKRIVSRMLQAKQFQDLLSSVQTERQQRNMEEKEDQKAVEQLKSKYTFSQLFSTENKRSILVLTVAWLLSVVIAYVIGISQTPITQAEIEPNFLEGLRQASLQEYREAAKQFSVIDFKKLSKTDQRIVLLTYLFSGQAQKALDLEPAFVEDVASYYSQVDKPGELIKLKFNHPSIRFEQEFVKKNYSAVIALQDQVALDQRRRKLIVTSYLEQGKIEQARRFATKFKDPELTKLIDEHK